MIKKLLLAISLLLSSNVYAATISIKQAWVTNYTAAGTSIATPLAGNVTAGNLVVVTIELGSTASVPTFTDNFGDTGGTSWSQAATATDVVDGNAKMYIFWRQVGSGGTIVGGTVTSNWTGSTVGDMQVAEYQPVSAATFALDGIPLSVTDTTGANPNLGNITLGQEGLIVSYLETQTTYPTAGTNYTVRLSPGSLIGKAIIEDYAPTTGGSIAVTWTNATSERWSAIGVGFKATSGGGSSIATINGLAKASVGTVNGLAIGSVSGVDGLP